MPVRSTAGCRYARWVRGIGRAEVKRVGDERMTADEHESTIRLHLFGAGATAGTASRSAADGGTHPPPVTAPPRSDPHRFGRVDADGTVWLISAAGERNIGSWQAGDPEAAFAHFGRRFEDLSTEITLMEERLTAGTGDARKIKANASALAETLPTASVLGDIDALAARLTGLVEQAGAIVAADRSRRDEHRAAQTAHKEALAAEAEDLAANSTQWKVAGDRMRAILDEWKNDHRPGPQNRRCAVEALFRGPGTVQSAARIPLLRAGPGAVRDPAVKGTALRAGRRAVRLDGLGRTPAPNSASCSPNGKRRDELARMSTTRCGTASKPPRTVLQGPQRRDGGKGRGAASNAGAKEALLAEAEKIDTDNHDAASAALRSIADKWDAIGKVPREQSADLERRLRAVEKKVRDAGETDWSDPQAQARAEQFRTRAEQFERQAQKAEAAGATKEAEEAKANAEQWRQWADAAAEALTRRS